MPTWALTALWIVNYAAVAIAIVHILLTRKEPRGMFTWILALFFLPVIGLVLYLLVGEVSIRRKVRRRRRRRQQIAGRLASRTAVLGQTFDARRVENLSTSQQSMIHLASRVSGAYVTSGNEVVIYNDAEQAFLALQLGIEAAQSHVHMLYYIFRDDDTGRSIGELLRKKARQGVEARLLLDAVGCWRMSRAFLAWLRDGGVKVSFFLPWGIMNRRLQMNCRNHRKLTVIDGRVGFTGSKNIGDEYLGRKKKLGPWRDHHLSMRGPCVMQLQEIFVEDWHFASGEDLSGDGYFHEPERAGNQLVQIVPSGPDGFAEVLHQLLIAAVSDAEQEIAIVTPYFVPDVAMLVALKWAAYRGVTVRLVVPHKSDHVVLLWAGRSFYEELLRSGIEIYEYQSGMLHSKIIIIDRRWAMVGSANMDIRSFQYNFEMTCMLYDEGLASGFQEQFDEFLRESKRIYQRDVKRWGYRERLAAGAARVATPVL